MNLDRWLESSEPWLSVGWDWATLAILIGSMATGYMDLGVLFALTRTLLPDNPRR